MKYQKDSESAATPATPPTTPPTIAPVSVPELGELDGVGGARAAEVEDCAEIAAEVNAVGKGEVCDDMIILPFSRT